jgi:sec-independent protein translocase protein TatC
VKDNPEKRMSLGEHIEDLRRCLVISVGSFVIAFILCISFGRQVITFARWPLVLAVKEMGLPPETVTQLSGSLSPLDGFAALVRFSLMLSLLISLPVLARQLWIFISPGLKEKERAAILPVFLFGGGMFALGMILAFIFACPVALGALLFFNEWLGFDNRWTGASIIQLVTMVCLGFGAVFELPLVLMIFGRLGMVSPMWLRKYRRHSIMAIFIIAAILTPPDPFTQIIMATVLMILYEISILLVARVYPWPDGTTVKR